MQFFILLIGALVFVFYQFNPSPLFFNKIPIEEVRQTSFRDSLLDIENKHAVIVEKKKQAVAKLPFIVSTHAAAEEEKVLTEMRGLHEEEEQLRTQVKKIIKSSNVKGEANDTNYIFLRFVMDYLPAGLVGLLIAVIFLAAWGSIAAALNSLASATMVDFHKKFFIKNQSDEQEYKTSRLYTLGWGIFCIVVAELVTGMGSLIEAVNVLGSWFYGVILGIFLVAFYFKRVGGNAVFWAALAGEVLVIGMYLQTNLAWLWLNAIGAIAVIIFAVFLQGMVFQKEGRKA